MKPISDRRRDDCFIPRCIFDKCIYIYIYIYIYNNNNNNIRVDTEARIAYRDIYV